MIRICADNDVASAKQKRDLRSAEMTALDRIFELHDQRKLVLEISMQSLREMERAPAKYQNELKMAVAKIGTAKENSKLLGFATMSDQYGGFSTQPLVTDLVDEKLYASFGSMGLLEDDAKQLMYAVHNGYDRFLTCDRDFLNRRSDLEKHCGSLRIQTPAEFVEEYDGKQS
jgi:hypothetical protein